MSCTARRRREETILVPAGIRGTALESLKKGKPRVVNADDPLIVVGTEPGYKGPNRTKEYVSQWLALRAMDPDITLVAAAKQMGITRPTLSTNIKKAVEEGWLKFTDPFDRIEHELVPKVLSNLSEFLDQKDKQVTIETAKGTIFKQFQENLSSEDAPQTILALRIETADPSTIKVVSGQVVGKPKQIIDVSEIEDES